MGRILYRTSASRAGQKPISPPNSGTMRANSARLGTVCTMPAAPRTHSASRGRPEAASPNGKLTSRPTAMAATDNVRCPPR